MPLPRKKPILVCAITLFAAVVAFLAWPSREPTYEGRTVTQWLAVLGRNQGSYPGKMAIQYFGTSAVPYMLENIPYEPPSFWYASNALARAICAVKLISDSIMERFYRSAGAEEAFRVLGPRAEGAIPELNRRLYRIKPRDREWVPLYALAAIGPKALPSLMSALTNADPKIRSAATNALLQIDPNALPKVTP